MLAAQPGGQGLRHHGVEEGAGQRGVVEALAVVREHGRDERVVAGLEVEEPAEEQVGVDPLAELALAADRVEREEQLGLEQALRGHARPPGRGVGRGELGGEGVEDAVGPPLDIAERVIGADAVLDRERVE